MRSLENVLVIVVDCLGSDALWGEGKNASTPHVDALCRAGVSFPNTITAATYTLPSITSLLTGLYPSAHGVRSRVLHKLSSGCKTLASILKEEGYETAAFVTGVLGKEIGLDQGFDQYEFRGVDNVVFEAWGQTFLETFASRFHEPWFLFLHLWELHRPRWVSPACDSREYGRTSYERALSSVDRYVGELMARIDLGKTVVVLTGDHGEVVPESHHVMLRSVARWVVNHSGPLRPILLKAAASRRWQRGSPRFAMACHGYSVSDVLARVPLMMAGGTVAQKGVVISEQVRTIDVTPTVLDLLGISPSEAGTFQGRSLVPLTRGAALDMPPALVVSSKNRWNWSIDPMMGIRTPGWKLVFAPYDSAFQWELFNLADDPWERRDVVNDFPDIAQDLHRQARQLLREGEKFRQLGEELSPREKEIVEARLRKLGYL